MAQLPCLFKAPEAWSLPSSSVACVQVEAYLRFTGLPFHIDVCSSVSKSPSGQTPALEHDALIAGLEDGVPAARGVLGEFAAARACMRFAARQCTDIDTHLSTSQRAELLAYSVLVETRLDVATLVSAWCEPSGVAEMRKVTAGHLPFPLSYIIPWGCQREVSGRFGHLDREEVYCDAVSALSALADKLSASPGPFFFGAKPTSLDAMLAGHLMYMRLSPAAPPVLSDKVGSSARLCAFVELMQREYFATAVSTPPPRSADAGSWSDAAKGKKKSKDEPKSEPTAAERQFARNSRYWLFGAGVAIAAYVLLSGQYIKVDFRPDDYAYDGDEDDDDDGGDE